MPDPGSPADRPPRVAIVGGGIAGLAAALRLHDARPVVDWRLFEATPRLGGALETVERNGYLVELGADNFLTREPWATDLAQRVGVAGRLLSTDAARRRALVVCRGRVRPVPEGFVLMAPSSVLPILASPVLSVAGKARLACEPLTQSRPVAPDGDESVASFARRRLGRETLERLVQPLVAGIYTADPERLSMAATLPQFLDQEREHGSLWRASRRSKSPSTRRESGARYGLFVAPPGGLAELTGAVVAQLPEERVHVGQPIGALSRTASEGWRVLDTHGHSLGDFDAVIVATPSYTAADLLREPTSELSARLDAIEYAGASIVCLGVRADQIAKPIEGFGFVVPTIERRRIIAASFASYKFPGRAPEGRVLVRVFVGGALQPELADDEDAELVRIAREELADLVGLSGSPEMSLIARWPRRMPQYHVGHLGRVDEIERLTPPDLALAGAAYRGVGVPQCVRSGEAAADRLLAHLRPTSHAAGR